MQAGCPAWDVKLLEIQEGCRILLPAGLTSQPAPSQKDSETTSGSKSKAGMKNFKNFSLWLVNPQPAQHTPVAGTIPCRVPCKQIQKKKEKYSR